MNLGVRLAVILAVATAGALASAGVKSEWPVSTRVDGELKANDWVVWKNRFPEGKAWKPDIGPCDAPALPSHGYRLKDGRIGLWEGGFFAYFQYAVDTDRNRLVAYVHNRLIEYDPAMRSWKELAPGPPSGGEQNLWRGSLRKLMLAVNSSSEVFALRLDPKSAELRELE